MAESGKENIDLPYSFINIMVNECYLHIVSSSFVCDLAKTLAEPAFCLLGCLTTIEFAIVQQFADLY